MNRFARIGLTTPPCGTPQRPLAFSMIFSKCITSSSSTRFATLANSWSCRTLSLPFTTRGSGDLSDQPGAAWLGQLLRGGALQRVLQLHSELGGEEGPAPYDEGSETRG